jgi:hypothetical protein
VGALVARLPAAGELWLRVEAVLATDEPWVRAIDLTLTLNPVS